MARDYTTDELLLDIRNLGSLPNDQSTYDDDNLLRLADLLLRLRMVPLLQEAKADYFLSFQDITLTAEQTVMDIPPQATKRALKSVVRIRDDGREIGLIGIDYDEEIANNFFAGVQRRLFRGAYYTRGDKVILYPEALGAGVVIRLYYYLLPNRLVLAKDAAKVQSIDTGTGIVTTTGLPPAWTTADTFCSVSNTPGFDLISPSFSASSVSSPNITLPLADAALLSVGDYLALEGDSPIPQLPIETHALLAQYVVVKALEGLGDDNHSVAKAELTEMIEGFRNMITLRVERAPKTLTNRTKLSDSM